MWTTSLSQVTLALVDEERTPKKKKQAVNAGMFYSKWSVKREKLRLICTNPTKLSKLVAL